MDYLATVREFHDAFGVENREAPHLEDDRTCELRLELISEELGELEEALNQADALGTLDALVDLQYVLSGAVLQLGFAAAFNQAFAEVHRSNMSKLDAEGRPIFREDGKVLKGPNYSPPQLSKFIGD